tara:strand:- start:246 stop:530 length:285 start_codon:yes stop_codon:yes gene_type:complete
MAKVEHLRKKLKKLVAIQECIDSQLCRSLERRETESNEGSRQAAFKIGIPKKSPIGTYSKSSTESSSQHALDCEEAASALRLLDNEILKIAQKK